MIGEDAISELAISEYFVAAVGSGIQHVQDFAELVVAAGTSGSVTGTVTAGNMLTCMVACDSDTGGSGLTFTFSDGVNSWSTKADLDNLATVGSIVAIGRAFNIAGGSTTVTVTCSHAQAGTFYARVQEWSGEDVTNPDVGSDTFFDSTAETSHECGSTGVTYTGNCLALAVGTLANTRGTGTPGSGYTQLTTASAFSLFQWQIFPTGVSSEVGAWTSGNSHESIGAIAVFKAAGAATSKLLLHRRRKLAI